MKKIRILLPVTITMVVIWLFYYTRLSSVKFYPVIINFVFFMIFFFSSFQKKTVIQKIAEGIDGKLPLEMISYTRKLNYIWAGVTFLNFLLSLITLFTSNVLWALYNGCISYCLIGLTFLIEYPIRIWYKRKIGF